MSVSTDIIRLEALAREGDALSAYELAVALASRSDDDADWARGMHWLDAASPDLATAQEQRRLLRAWRDPAGWPPIPPPEALCRAPVVLALPALLSPELCDWLRLLGAGLLGPARVFDPRTGEGRVDDGRTNSAGAFRAETSDMILALARRRIAAASGVPTVAFEASQILRYEVGQTFDWHVDYLDSAIPAFAADVARRGQRIATCLIYLNDDFEGGETAFTVGDIRHRGRKGDGLMWSNVLPEGDIDPATGHAGLPPSRGTKWVLSQWIRDRPQP